MTKVQHAWAIANSDVELVIYLAVSDETFVICAEHASPVVNYPEFPDGCRGIDLTFVDGQDACIS
jgi:hypothetical protein